MRVSPECLDLRGLRIRSEKQTNTDWKITKMEWAHAATSRSANQETPQVGG
jgi:hypothetical protein